MAKPKYFKRHRMEIALPCAAAENIPELPPALRWAAWDDSLLEHHAEVKFQSFYQHEDVRVFPSLGTHTGCQALMEVIRSRRDFCPEATWLIVGPNGGVATVQGLIDNQGFGSIQNLGVVPEYRGLGLGRAILLKALAGFASVGVSRAFLEVTATNEPAVRLYRAIGFRACRTLYRQVELPESEPVGVGL